MNEPELSLTSTSIFTNQSSRADKILSNSFNSLSSNKNSRRNKRKEERKLWDTGWDWLLPKSRRKCFGSLQLSDLNLIKRKTFLKLERSKQKSQECELIHRKTSTTMINQWWLKPKQLQAIMEEAMLSVSIFAHKVSLMMTMWLNQNMRKKISISRNKGSISCRQSSLTLLCSKNITNGSRKMQ